MMGSSLPEIRANKFLNNKTTLLKLLPPTENAFMEHLKRSALATAIDKSAHIARPEIPALDDYGWTLAAGRLIPVPVTASLWPDDMAKSVSCGCKTGCSKNCSCAKRQVPCFLGCKCHGSLEKCSRAKYLIEFNESSNSDSEGDCD
jgi:hypothetical protein